MVPHEIPRFLGSYLEGVECPPNSDAKQRRAWDASVARDDGYAQGDCQDIRELGCPIHSSHGCLVLCGIRWRSYAALGALRNGGLAPGEVLAFLL